MDIGIWLLALLGSINDISSDNARWVHPLCQPLDVNTNGPFVALPDGSLLTVDSQGMRISRDDGKTWSPPHPICPGFNNNDPSSTAIVRTKNGTLVIVYLDFTTFLFNWDNKTGEPKKSCQLELWAIRSLDGGKTWTDRQKLLDGYNANFFGFIQTRTGRLVAVVEHLVRNPARWVACSLISDDEGKTWKSSNFIDLGGHGHHDGATEPTVAELSDGRLLMLIRTNLNRFWQAISEDGGRYWRIIQPSSIDASSSPGYLIRLHSGRLVLVWNRLNPEGRVLPRVKPGPHAEVDASWHREELSISFSEDDGKSWTRPVVIARQKGGQVSYPYLFERRPGELWITTALAFRGSLWKDSLPLRLKLNEEKFVRFVKGK